MQYITKLSVIQQIGVWLSVLAVVSVLMLTLGGQMSDSLAGWITCPAQVTGVPLRSCRLREVRASRRSWQWVAWGQYLAYTFLLPLARSLLVGVFWYFSGQRGPAWVILIPWGAWLWHSVGWLWPQMLQQREWRSIDGLLWQLQRGVLMGYLVLAVSQRFPTRLVAAFLSLLSGGAEPLPISCGLLLGCTFCLRQEPRVEVVSGEDGSYTASLCGHFTLRVGGDDPFRKRLLLLFLRLLEVPGQERGSRRTRDSRTPFVRQQYLAQVFSMPQPEISRIEGYWLEGDWANLLSLKTAEVLTQELQAHIVEAFATFPWWGVKRVYEHLRAQGVAVSERQVRQAAEQSGWSRLRAELMKRYQLTAESLRPREEWLTGELLRRVETLLGKLESGEGLTPEEHLSFSHLQTLAKETGVVPPPPLKALPWLMRVERLVFGHWEEVTDGSERCIYCGSSHVVRKSRKPRLKRYYDAEGNLRTVEVYRYYCRNPQCEKGSFTHLPLGLVPYSPYRTEVHLLAIQMYEWGYSTYRRTAAALGVAGMTAYRWVKAWGHGLLPVAALFGVVKSSGVVGVDEKYILAPKNDKPAGEMRRWMYVYFAVDVYTYDLLHIAVYPYNTQESALAFLLALRAKGYHPRVIVTDLRQDYGPVIARVFPKAEHHECIFHAMQNLQAHFKEVYGKDYPQTHAEAVTLKQKMYAIFEAQTRRTAEKRYAEVMAQRERYVRETPEAAAIFDFLERHWPKLVNGIESKRIPRTNNVVELVIRRFDQHYQNFCGFDSLETAQDFLGVFEKVYRFTPFSADAQGGVRGKSPLELAGYDIRQIPMALLCAGHSVDWPLELPQETAHNHVPKP